MSDRESILVVRGTPMLSTKHPAEKVSALVGEHVSAYCARYGIVPVFPISPPWDIEEGYQRDLQFPDAGATGCYAMYSADGDLLYIGKTSLNNSLGGRLTSYFMGVRSSNPGAPRGNWKSPPKYLQTIRVNEPYEAPSLEEYLILKLQPCENALRGCLTENIEENKQAGLLSVLDGAGIAESGLADVVVASE